MLVDASIEQCAGLAESGLTFTAKTTVGSELMMLCLLVMQVQCCFRLPGKMGLIMTGNLSDTSKVHTGPSG